MSGAPQARSGAAERRGLALGLLGVLVFALTLPMTRLAVGADGAPQLSGSFVAFGRAAVAGLLSATFLWLTRAPRPAAQDWRAIAAVAAGAVFGFPLCTSIALRQVDAVHASVMLGVLPLATAAVGARVFRQRPSGGFWACSALGSVLVAAYALHTSGGAGLALRPADGLLLAGMAWGAVAYVAGAHLAGRLPAEHVICWALVLSLPVTLPAAAWTAPQATIRPAAWAGFGYVALFSMWLGFFAWYRGLALGGTVRVSQVQLLQPFLSMLAAVPLLGETLDTVSLAFGVAVFATVALGRRQPVHGPTPLPTPSPTPTTRGLS